MRPVLIVTVILIAIGPSPTRAQETNRSWSDVGPRPVHRAPGKWGVGASAFYSTEPYEDFDNEIVVFPMVTYFGPRLFVTGPRAGYKVMKRGSFALTALAMYDFSGYEEDDSDVFEGMDDRDGTVMAGAALSYDLPWKLEIEADLMADILGRHDGRTGSLELQRTWRNGKWFVTPGVGLAWQSPEVSDYLYGVRGREATPERPAYDLADTFNWELSLGFRYLHSERLMFIAMPRLEFLDRDIRDSPIVSEDVLLSGFMGFSYSL
ncbi:MAG: MipA/OmpV family protein [Kiritimatiellae bacterium]|nr:MipA/OmpV family protein [Kiritimatiellia bacterium]